jgi:ketosteroid isomerase-like protein
MTPEELDAREQIRDLVARYNANGDSGRFDEVLALFCRDATMKIEDTVYTGIEEISTIFTSTRDRVATAATPQLMRHHTATHQIDLLSDTEATGRAYFQVIMTAGLDHWGRYLDSYRREGDRWKFSTRHVVTDGYAENSLFK